MIYILLELYVFLKKKIELFKDKIYIYIILMQPASEITSKPSFGQYIDTISKEMENMGKTWNGDINYKTIGTEVPELILGFTQKLLNDMLSFPNSDGKGSKRKGNSGLPLDPTLNIPEYIRTEISEKFNNIMHTIQSKSQKDKCIYLDMLFRCIFHERAIPRSGQGKGHKSIAYHLWHEMYKHMPKTCIKLLYLMPKYGYYRDLDKILHHNIKNQDIVMECAKVYYKSLCDDFNEIFDRDMKQLTPNQIFNHIKTYYNKVKLNESKPMDERESYDKSVSLVGKWLPRENKKYTFIRQYILALIFCNGNIKEYNQLNKKTQKSKSETLTKHRAEATLRRFLTTLNIICGTVESKMSAKRYEDIDPTKMTSGAIKNYRKYLLNQDQDDTYQDRSYDLEAYELADRTKKAAINNKLNGGAIDSVSLARLIQSNLENYVSNPDNAECQIINAQFENLCETISSNLTKEYDCKMTIWLEEGSIPEKKPLDPFNVFATIDTSPSMSGAQVLAPAIILGIIVTKISKLGNTFMTFSTNPQLVSINPDENVFSIYNKITKANWAGSTNIDKANCLLADMMYSYKKINPKYNGQLTHIIFTDGQFDSSFVSGWSDQTYHSYTSGTNINKKWNTAAERMEKYFTKYNLCLPNTIFWNMNSRSPGFPATGDMKGLQLAEGLSHGMIVSALTNGCEYVADNGGTKKSNISPIESFLKTIYHNYFDDVSEIVHETREGVFASYVSE